MIGYWTRLADGTLGVRVKGTPVVGAVIVVRYADAREPVRETVAAIVERRGIETLVRIERETT